MIEAFRFEGKVVLQVPSTSSFESALLQSAGRYSISLKPIASGVTGVSRYRLSASAENTFGSKLSVVFRRWPRRKRENRVRAEIRRMAGNRYECQTTDRQVQLTAPQSDIALVRCGLHAGTHGWALPRCLQA